MCAFDALIAAPRATLVDFPILEATNLPGGGQFYGFVSSAMMARKITQPVPVYAAPSSARRRLSASQGASPKSSRADPPTISTPPRRFR